MSDSWSYSEPQIHRFDTGEIVEDAILVNTIFEYVENETDIHEWSVLSYYESEDLLDAVTNLSTEFSQYYFLLVEEDGAHEFIWNGCRLTKIPAPPTVTADELRKAKEDAK